MKKPALHLEIQRRDTTPVGILRSTFRDPVDGRIRHSQHGRLTGLPLPTLELIQATLRGEVILKSDPNSLRILHSREFGASDALVRLARDIGLDRDLYSRPSEPWVKDCLAMIISRVIEARSKLALSQSGSFSCLWELCGVDGPVDVNKNCYESMDRLLERQAAIQKNLATRRLSPGPQATLVLYDITSSYFEGEYAGCDLVQFGYNRDGKRGHEQVVIGLITDAVGCPISVEVFPGNTQDASTVEEKIRELRHQYGVENLVFVGDRGMVTSSNEEKLKALPEGEGLQIISALTHREIVQMLAKTNSQPELFDSTNVVEISDPEDPTRRYCLCRNPLNQERESRTRDELIARAEKDLARIAATALRSQVTKSPASPELIGSRVGKALEKTKMGKYFTWSVEEGGLLSWTRDQSRVEADAALDGCYVIKTTVAATQMDKDTVVKTYKSLSQVEQAFRNMKRVSLEMRPMWHKTEDRIRAHVFICMLAYYLQWHMKDRLAPIFEEQARRLKEGSLQPKERQWTLAHVVSTMAAQQSNRVSLSGHEFTQVTEPSQEHQRILQLLLPDNKPDPATRRPGGGKRRLN
jgi:transposase